MPEVCDREFTWLFSLTAAIALALPCASAVAVEHDASILAGKPGRNSLPNILVIIADDLGYSDIGAFGGEIQTPNLDTLAHDGLRLTNFHTAATCSPTRAMLLSGTDHHPVGLGTMPGHLSSNQAGKPGYEMHLNDQALSIASLLRDVGYSTYIAGKWHLGGKPAHRPNRRGFERSFVLVEGGGSHFDDQLGPTSKFPKANYLEDGDPVDSLPAGFFSTDFYTEKMISYIDQDFRDEKPFFAVLSYTAPHWPLQAPESYLDRYRGMYDRGYQAVMRQRLEKMKKLELIEPTREAYADSIIDWQQLSEEDKALESRRMEIYAAMVEHMDQGIGRLIQYLKDEGEYDNTLILFLSDNGPEGRDPKNLHNNKEWVPATFDNSFENMGKRKSFVSYGPNWGQVSAVPHRGFKASIYQGGIVTPLIVSFPGGNFRVGISKQFLSVKDIAPTLRELTGVYSDGSLKTHDGKIPMTGVSLLPYLQGKESQVHPPSHEMGWEILGSYGIRKGNWKAVHANQGWQVFDLVQDPSEKNDLASARPDKLAELLSAWNRYVAEFGVILPNEDVGY